MNGKLTTEIFYNPGFEKQNGSPSFPFKKYKLIKNRLITGTTLEPKNFTGVPAVKPENLALIHSENYINKALRGTLPIEHRLQSELKYPQKAARVALKSCRATYLSSRVALNKGRGIFLGGGFTHAYKNKPGAFSVFNDVAYAAMKLSGLNKKVLILDCDLHQADGTIKITGQDENIRILSFYSKEFYPLIKAKPDWGMELNPSISGEKYNNVLAENLRKALDNFHPDIIIYIAGACGYKEDIFGNLNLKKKDFVKRDNVVLNLADSYNIPLAVLLGGGNAKNLKDTVDIHIATIKKAVRL